jgi:hypothetical protein
MQRRRSLLLATTAVVTVGIGVPASAAVNVSGVERPIERLASIRAAYLSHLNMTQGASSEDASTSAQTAQFPNFPNFSNWRNR